MFATATGVKEGSGRFFRLTIAASVALHVAAGATLVVASFWKITKLSPKVQELVFREPLEDGAHAKESPATPPPATKPSASGVRASARVAQRADRREVEPRTAADSAASQASSLPGAETDPSGDPGTGTGQGASGVGGDKDVPGIGLPQTPVDDQDRQPGPGEIEGQRLSGNRDIRLPDQVLATLRMDGRTALRVSVQLCIDEQGLPTAVRFTPSSGYDQVDELIREQMLQWRYRPWVVRGTAVRVCTPVTFSYRITP